MDQIRQRQLDDFLGEHILTAAFCDDTVDKVANRIRFCLDGITIEAVEDPDDGYRSSLRDIYVAEERCPHDSYFAPHKVLGRMRPDTSYEQNHVLELVSVRTGEVILSVGTENVGDYYPSWEASFDKTKL